MPVAILSALVAAFKAVAALFGWKANRDLLDAGRASERAGAIAQKVKADAQATQAREAVRADLAVHPERLRDNDGFRRD